MLGWFGLGCFVFGLCWVGFSCDMIGYVLLI